MSEDHDCRRLSSSVEVWLDGSEPFDDGCTVWLALDDVDTDDVSWLFPGVFTAHDIIMMMTMMTMGVIPVINAERFRDFLLLLIHALFLRMPIWVYHTMMTCEEHDIMFEIKRWIITEKGDIMILWWYWVPDNWGWLQNRIRIIFLHSPRQWSSSDCIRNQADNGGYHGFWS